MNMNHDAIVDDLKFNSSSIIKTINGDFVHDAHIHRRRLWMVSYKHRILLAPNDGLNELDLFRLNDNGKLVCLKRAVLNYDESFLSFQTFPNHDLVLIYNQSRLNGPSITIYKLNIVDNVNVEVSLVKDCEKNPDIKCGFHLTNSSCFVDMFGIHVYNPKNNSWRFLSNKEFDNPNLKLNGNVNNKDHILYNLLMENYRAYLRMIFTQNGITKNIIGEQFGTVIKENSEYYQVNFEDGTLTTLPKFYKDLYDKDEYIVPASPVVKDLTLDFISNLIKIKDVAKLIMDYIFIDSRLFI